MLEEFASDIYGREEKFWEEIAKEAKQKIKLADILGYLKINKPTPSFHGEKFEDGGEISWHICNGHYHLRLTSKVLAMYHRDRELTSFSDSRVEKLYRELSQQLIEDRNRPLPF